MNSIPFADYLVFAIFALAVGTTIGGALIAALTKRMIRGVSGLMISCVGLAGLYYFLGSPFLALMEILIYVGAVCVTIVFGVMLSETDELAEQEGRRHTLRWGASSLVVAALVFGGVAYLSLHGGWAVRTQPQGDGSIDAIGISLLTTYSLPFELISIVLLVAILGALVIARSGRTKE